MSCRSSPKTAANPPGKVLGGPTQSPAQRPPLSGAAWRHDNRWPILRWSGIGLLAAVTYLGAWNELSDRPPRRHAAPLPHGLPPGLDAAKPPSTSAPSPVASIETANRLHIQRGPGQPPAWAIAFGKEFWRRPVHGTTSQTGAGAAGAESPASVNVADVIERVSHALSGAADGQRASLKAKTYTASFDGSSMRFSPDRPAGSQGQSPSSETRRTVARRTEPDPQTEGVFRTVSIRRGDLSFFSANGLTPQWSILGDTAQASLSPDCGLVEHYEARSTGVEVAWVLSRPLSGVGSLVVEAELAGLTCAGETEQGHHFADARGTPRVRVGNVSVVDVSGRSWDVRATAQGNELRIEVSAEILGLATYPLAIDPVIGPEFGMDNPVIGSSASDQFAPRLASIGANYLVVWTDDRNGSADIYGARVTGSGAISDPTGIAISVAAGDQLSPSVAADGNNYEVAWEDHRNQAASGADIYAARVTTSGVVLDAGGIPIATAPNDQITPGVAFNGTNYLVVWADSRTPGTNGPDIYAARLSTNSVVLDVGGIAVSASPSSKTSPGVASSGGSYLVVWQDSRNSATNGMDIYGALVASDGSVLNPNGIAISTATNEQVTPNVASSSTNYLVVWADSRALSDNGSDIYAARVAANGAVMDANGIPLSTVATFETLPSVAANGADFLVVWEDSRNSISSGENIYGTRVSGGGSVLDAGGIAISTATGDQGAPTVVASGTNYLVVWQDGRGASENIYGARVTAAGAVTDSAGFVISTGPNAEVSPAVAFNGILFLVVWTDNRNSTTTGLDIYGARVTTNGSVADVNGIAISTATGTQFAPALAANGTNFLVAWADSRNGTDFNIFGTRITGAGTVLDANGLAISTATDDQTAPTVSANGSGYLVAWQDNRNLAATFSDIYGARVTTNGVVSDVNGIPISRAGNVQASPRSASDGTNFLVAWTDFRGATLPPSADIFASRVTGAGLVLDTNGIAICTATNDQSFPAVAFNGTNYLVVWQDSRNGADYDIYGARVSTAGVVAEANGFVISAAANDQSVPAVTANGGDFFVLWGDMRNAAASGGDVFGARVSGGGSVLDVSGLPVNADGATEQNPAVTAGGAGQLLAITQDSLTGADRALGNFVFTVVPLLSVSPTNLDFGLLAIGQSSTQSFQVINSGGLTLTGSVVTTLPFGIRSGSPFSLPPGQTGLVQVTFSPGNSGSFSNLIVFNSNGGTLTNTVTGNGAAVPLASFVGSPTNGIWPLAVSFSDNSSGTISNRFWDFGDGTTTNTAKTSFTHTYTGAGTNTVTLKVTGPAGTNTLARSAYIVVTNVPPPFIQSLSLSNGVATIVWTAIPARTYRVQYRLGLTVGTAWSNLTPDVVATAFTATYQDKTLGVAAQRFYRVLAVP